MKEDEEFYQRSFKLIQKQLSKSGMFMIDPNKNFKEVLINIGKDYYKIMKSKEF